MKRLILCLVLVFVLAGASVSQARDFTIAIASDGASQAGTEYIELVKAEFSKLVADGVRVHWLDRPEFSAGWDVDNASKALQAALDSKADVVVCQGVLVTQAALVGPALTKPVVGGPYLADEAMGLPVKEDRSQRKNLVFSTTQGRVSRDMQSLVSLLPVKKLALLIDRSYWDGLRFIKPHVADMEQKFNLDITPVFVTDSVEDAVAAIPSGMDAVYLGSLPRLDNSGLDSLMAMLQQKKMPSYAFMGRPWVERGAMAGLAPFAGRQLARRAALNLRDIADGAKPETLPVSIRLEEQLYINKQTVLAVGASPRLDALRGAELLDEVAATGVPLTLDEAITMAGNRSLSAGMGREEVRMSEADKRIALSNMLPHASANLTYAQLDQDRSIMTRNQYPWEKLTTGVGVTQVLFNDDVITAYRRAGRSIEGRKLLEESARLDSMRDGGLAYIAFLAAKAMYDIERENLSLTRSLLEMAKVRRDSGVSGPEDVYRWEAAEAGSRSALVAREAEVKSALATLNLTLNQPLETVWQAVPFKPRKARGYLFGNFAPSLMETPKSMEVFVDRVTALSMNLPAIRALEKSREAQQLLVDRKVRSHFVPSLGASFNYEHEIDKTQIGPTRIQDPDPFEDTFDVGVSLSLPILEGGATLAETAQAKAELRRIGIQLLQTEQKASTRARLAAYNAGRSYPAIDLAVVATERSRKNLNVIRDRYRHGAVSVITLIDARNQVLTWERQTVAAVYGYLQDIVELQHAVGWFASGKSPQDQETFLTQLVN